MMNLQNDPWPVKMFFLLKCFSVIEILVQAQRL